MIKYLQQILKVNPVVNSGNLRQLLQDGEEDLTEIGDKQNDRFKNNDSNASQNENSSQRNGNGNFRNRGQGQGNFRGTLHGKGRG